MNKDIKNLNIERQMFYLTLFKNNNDLNIDNGVSVNKRLRAKVFS